MEQEVIKVVCVTQTGPQSLTPLPPALMTTYAVGARTVAPQGLLFAWGPEAKVRQRPWSETVRHYLAMADVAGEAKCTLDWTKTADPYRVEGFWNHEEWRLEPDPQKNLVKAWPGTLVCNWIELIAPLVEESDGQD